MGKSNKDGPKGSHNLKPKNIIRIELDMPYVQQPIPIPHSYEGRLPSRPSFDVRTNIFGDIWTSHKSLGFSYTNYRE
jgi:hypothetical protein